MIVPSSIEKALLRLTVTDGSGTFDPSINKDAAKKGKRTFNFPVSMENAGQLTSAAITL